MHPEAIAEVNDAAAWYEAQRAGLGSDLIDAVYAVLTRLESRPREFGKMRRTRIARFPYAIILQEDASEHFIIALAHLHRRPNYWRKRLPSEP